MYLQMWRKGMTLDDIAAQEGLSRYQVHRRIIKERWASGEVVISERALRKDVQAGMTVREMGQKYMCSIGCISYKLKKYGIKTRPPGNPNWRSDEKI